MKIKGKSSCNKYYGLAFWHGYSNWDVNYLTLPAVQGILFKQKIDKRFTGSQNFEKFASTNGAAAWIPVVLRASSTWAEVLTFYHFHIDGIVRKTVLWVTSGARKSAFLWLNRNSYDSDMERNNFCKLDKDPEDCVWILGTIWEFPKIMVPPNHPILIGCSIIFTIHFGGFPPIFGNTHMGGSTILKWWGQLVSATASPASRPKFFWARSAAADHSYRKWAAPAQMLKNIKKDMCWNLFAVREVNVWQPAHHEML